MHFSCICCKEKNAHYASSRKSTMVDGLLSSSCYNLVCLPSWRWWQIGHPFCLHELPSFLKRLSWWCEVPRQASSSLNNFWMQPVSAWKFSVAERPDNLTHFIQVRTLTHPVLGLLLFNVVNRIVVPRLTIHWTMWQSYLSTSQEARTSPWLLFCCWGPTVVLDGSIFAPTQISCFGKKKKPLESLETVSIMSSVTFVSHHLFLSSLHLCRRNWQRVLYLTFADCVLVQHVIPG